MVNLSKMSLQSNTIDYNIECDDGHNPCRCCDGFSRSYSIKITGSNKDDFCIEVTTDSIWEDDDALGGYERESINNIYYIDEWESFIDRISVVPSYRLDDKTCNLLYILQQMLPIFENNPNISWNKIHELLTVPYEQIVDLDVYFEQQWSNRFWPYMCIIYGHGFQLLAEKKALLDRIQSESNKFEPIDGIEIDTPIKYTKYLHMKVFGDDYLWKIIGHFL